MIADYGIFIEIIGFIGLIMFELNRIQKLKRFEKFQHVPKWVRNVSIITVIVGVALQHSYFANTFPNY